MPKILDVRKITRLTNQNGSVAWKITVPPSWVKKHNLEDGGSVMVLEDGNNNLIVQPINT